MRIVINRLDFLKQLQIVNAVPINDKAEYSKSGLLLEAKENKLVFKINGDGIYLISETNCEVLEEGIVNIRHNLIEEFLKQIDDENIEIKVTDNSLSIVANNDIETAFAILEISTENDILAMQSKIKYTFNKQDFLEKLEKVKFAAATKLDMDYLNTVRLEILEKKMKLIATDSYRMMYLEETIDNEILAELKVNLPLQTIDGLIKVLKLSNDESITITSEGVRISFNFGATQIYSKVIEKQFPAYESLFKALNGEKELIIELDSFKQLLRRLQVFEKQDKSSSVKFEMQNNKMTASISNSLSKFKESIGLIYEDDEKITVSLTVKYVLDFINTLKNEKVLVVKMNNNDREPLVMYINNDKEKVYYFLMPARV